MKNILNEGFNTIKKKIAVGSSNIESYNNDL